MTYKMFCERYDFIINQMNHLDSNSNEYQDLGFELGHLIEDYPDFDKQKSIDEQERKFQNF